MERKRALAPIIVPSFIASGLIVNHHVNIDIAFPG